MSDDFDWVIEYETLPPDDPLPTESLPPDRPPHRRPPRWLWPLAGLLVIISGILIYLWTLGGKADPLPDPDPPSTRLEAAVQLEINALLTGDQELFEQMQDGLSRRSNFQPPPEAWFNSPELAGEIDLIQTQLLDEDSGIVEVELTWAGVPYRLTWFYRKVDEQWFHTDWQPFDAGASESLNSSHLEVRYNQMHEKQAVALQGEIEDFISAYCALLDCPAEPFSITLIFDNYTPYYLASEENPPSWHSQVRSASPDNSSSEANTQEYRIPSPLRVRWPSDGSPEPVVLTSLCRHLAYDLYARSRADGLSPENRAALIISTSWLAHHLAGSQVLPTTFWLEEAVSADGPQSGVDFIKALVTESHPHAALLAAFAPETVAAVTNLPDYIGWLSQVLDPHNQINSQPYIAVVIGLPPRNWPLEQRFDWLADPWEADGDYYSGTAPEIVDVNYQDGWAIARGRPGTGWQSTYFFKEIDQIWTPSKPDETILGTPQVIQEELFSLTYWACDEPYIPGILEILGTTHRSLISNFALSATNPISYLLTPIYGDLETLSFSTANMVRIVSPTSRTWSGTQEDLSSDLSFDSEIILAAMNKILQTSATEIKPESWLLASAIYIWQYEELAEQLDLPGYTGYTGLPDLDSWQRPASASGGSWKPLEELWGDWDNSSLTEADAVQLSMYSRMVLRFIVDRYGTDATPRMFRALGTADSMADWVQAVTGQPLDQFEAEWRSWVLSN